MPKNRIGFGRSHVSVSREEYQALIAENQRLRRELEYIRKRDETRRKVTRPSRDFWPHGWMAM